MIKKEIIKEIKSYFSRNENIWREMRDLNVYSRSKQLPYPKRYDSNGDAIDRDEYNKLYSDYKNKQETLNKKQHDKVIQMFEQIVQEKYSKMEQYFLLKENNILK